MTWWMIVLIVLAALALIGCVPVGVDAAYGDAGPSVSVKAGPFLIRLLPKKEKPAKKPKRAKKPKKPGKAKPVKEKKGSGLLSGGLEGIWPLLELLTDTLGSFRRKLVVNELSLHVTFGGRDAASSALNYGRAWAVIGGITPVIDNLFSVKKRDIQPILDYNETSIKLDARLILTITIGRALALALTAGLRFLKILIDKKKAVRKNESSTL